jgi:hypothetical protein
MAKASGNRLIGRILLLSALGCGASGLLLLPVHAMFGLVLSAVALADLGLVWLLRSRWPKHHPEATLAPH